MNEPSYDIAVLGAGPAGANAALAAAAHDLKVVVLDEQLQAGGQVWRAKSAAILKAPATPESRAGDDLRTQLSMSAVDHLQGTRVWHIAREGDVWIMQVLRGVSSEIIRAKALILATGAREYVQPVPGWTTPGVVGLAAATALFKQDLTLPGKRTVVSGTGPLVFYVASEIRRLGGEVVAVVTPNSRTDWLRAMPSMLSKPALLARGALWMADLTLSRVPIYWRHAVSRVTGQSQMRGVEVTRLDVDWAPNGMPQKLDADSLCMGHGLVAQTEAAQMLGVTLHHDPALGGWIPDSQEDGATNVPFLYVCGDGSGIRGVEAARLHGALAGLRVADDLGETTWAKRQALRRKLMPAARFGVAMTALSRPRAGLAQLTTNSTVVCRCEGITRKAVLAEVATGAASTNSVKSGVRAGMGPCGGKYCQTVIAALIAERAGMPLVAPPAARPPLRPVPLDAAAGVFEYGDLPKPKAAPL